MKNLKVRVVYRNYKPLHKLFQALVNDPPPGVTYLVPKVHKRLNRLIPLYRKLRYSFFGRRVIKGIESTFFLKKPPADADIYHYVGMVDPNPPNKPYMVDIEHAAALLSFTYNTESLSEAKKFLQNPNCKAINCYSNAAQRNLRGLLKNDYSKIAHKVNVVYPSPPPLQVEKYKPDFRYVKDDPDKLKLLFVGNRAYLKGIEEFLAAIETVNGRFSPGRLEAHIISDDAEEAVRKYNLPNVRLYQPRFNESQIISQFYLTTDALVSPTKQDTYGMAILESLNCGKPVIATSQFAIPELVSDGRDGILLKVSHSLLDDAVIPQKAEIDAAHRSNLDQQLVDQQVAVFTKILEDKVDLQVLGRRAASKFRDGGKFSASTRKQKLAAIYQKAAA